LFELELSGSFVLWRWDRGRGHGLRKGLKTPLVEEWVPGEREFRRVFLKGLGIFLLFNSVVYEVNIIKSRVLLEFHHI